MKSKNHIKNPTEDSLRGIGKLGWTESGKMHGDLKRLISTFDDGGISATKKKRIIVTCNICKRKFKTVSGKLPIHKGRMWLYSDNKYCNGAVTAPPIDINEAKTHAGDLLTVGDIILFTLPKWQLFKYISELYCGKILKIQKYDATRNNAISFEIEGNDKVFWLYEITKNLIYLTEDEYHQYKSKSNE